MASRSMYALTAWENCLRAFSARLLASRSGKNHPSAPAVGAWPAQRPRSSAAAMRRNGHDVATSAAPWVACATPAPEIRSMASRSMYALTAWENCLRAFSARLLASRSGKNHPSAPAARASPAGTVTGSVVPKAAKIAPIMGPTKRPTRAKVTFLPTRRVVVRPMRSRSELLGLTPLTVSSPPRRCTQAPTRSVTSASSGTATTAGRSAPDMRSIAERRFGCAGASSRMIRNRPAAATAPARAARIQVSIMTSQWR